MDSGSKVGEGYSKVKQDSCSDDFLLNCTLSLHFGMLDLCFSLFCPWVNLVLLFRHSECLLVPVEAFQKNLMLFRSILCIRKARLVKASQKKTETPVSMIRKLVEHYPYILAG